MWLLLNCTPKMAHPNEETIRKLQQQYCWEKASQPKGVGR
jgi:hypothetical protein